MSGSSNFFSSHQSRRALLKSLGAFVFMGMPLLKIKNAFSSEGTEVQAPLLGQLNSLRRISAESVFSNDDSYQSLRFPFNSRLNHLSSPQAILRPKNIGEIQEIMRWATAHPEHPLNIRSGGHCYEDFSSGNGVLLEMGNMKSIVVDPSSRRVRVGSGVRIGELVSAISAYNLALPSGICPGVGVAGLTLGGGHGLLSRMFGLTCDRLRSIEYVLADGTHVRASDNENPGLFWASRGGGGGQFGVAAEFELEAVELERVVSIQLWYPPSAREAVFTLFQELAPKLPREITLGMYMDQYNCMLRGVHIANETSTRELLQGFLALNPSVRNLIQEESYPESIVRFGGPLLEPMQPVASKSKSHYFGQPLQDSALALLFSGIQRGKVGYIFLAHGGAISDLAPDATAYRHRSSPMSLQYYTQWTDDAERNIRLARLNQTYAELAPYAEGSYVNYCDADLKNWKEAYYGENLSRLEQIKRAYDPTLRLVHAQALGT